MKKTKIKIILATLALTSLIGCATTSSTPTIVECTKDVNQNGRKQVMLVKIGPRLTAADAQIGDFITSINGVPVSSKAELVNWYIACAPDLPIHLLVQRNGELKKITVKPLFAASPELTAMLNRAQVMDQERRADARAAMIAIAATPQPQIYQPTFQAPQITVPDYGTQIQLGRINGNLNQLNQTLMRRY